MCGHAGGVKTEVKTPVGGIMAWQRALSAVTAAQRMAGSLFLDNGHAAAQRDVQSAGNCRVVRL